MHVACMTTPAPPTTDECPSLLDLLRFPGQAGLINIPQEIGVKFTEFGVFLLGDKRGSRVASLALEHGNNARRINTSILREWLEGKGRLPVTWRTLVDVLCDVELNDLASDITVGIDSIG